MKINIIKRKASSYKDLSTIQMEVGNPAHLLELLHTINQNQIKEIFQGERILELSEIQDQAKSGKVAFEPIGNQPANQDDQQLIIQDFQDGLFRVFLNEEELTDLYTPINLQENDTLVIIKFIMLAGRRW